MAFFTVVIFSSFWLVTSDTANADTCQCINNGIETKPFPKYDVSSTDECSKKCSGYETYNYYYPNGTYTTGVPSVEQKNNTTPANASNKSTASGSGSYVPMESIPGFGRPGSFPAYLMAVYKFGLWAIGICALLMITIGGYMYLASAGNKASAETAKKVITDAIAGIILALVSWLLLYLINPDLVKLTFPGTINQAATTPATSTPSTTPKDTPGSTASTPGWYFTWYNWLTFESGEYGPNATKAACEASRKNVHVNVSANYECYEKTDANISSDNTQKGCCIFQYMSKNKCRKDCTQRICDTLPSCIFQKSNNNCDNCVNEPN